MLLLCHSLRCWESKEWLCLPRAVCGGAHSPGYCPVRFRSNMRPVYLKPMYFSRKAAREDIGRRRWEDNIKMSLTEVGFKCDSSVGMALAYGLNDGGSRVRFPAGAGNFSLHHRVQNGSGAHPASYSRGTSGSFLGGKGAEAWSWPLTSI
jgi:hypothetical protein